MAQKPLAGRERLHQRLAGEYELPERHRALERKLDLIARTASTLLTLQYNRRSLRVEWYIVALIVVEILLTLGERLCGRLRPVSQRSGSGYTTAPSHVESANRKGAPLMRKGTIIALGAALCLLLVAGTAPAQDPLKLAYVDMQKALNESRAGKKALGELQKLAEERKSGLQKQKEALEKKKEELDKQALMLNEDARKSRESEIRTLERDLSRTMSDLKEEFGRRESEFTDAIRKDLIKVVEKIGKEGGYTLVLEKNFSAILYAPPTIDLTETLIKRYDAEGAK